MRIGEQIVRANKETAIFNTRLFSSCLLAVMCALLLTTCYLEGDLEALRPLGSGTGTDPFKVFDVATLQRVGSGRYGWELNKCYEQIAPIDLSSVANWDPIGTESAPFTGNFNGQGFTISNLVIKSSTNNQGLFGVIGKDGKVEYVNLAGIDISGDDNTCTNTGTVAGLNYGIVTNCCSSGSIKGYDYVGGLVGKNDASDGGNGQIINSYSTCNVQGNKYVGGVAGSNGSEHGLTGVFYCFSTGKVEGDEYVGGIVGENSNGCPVNNCVALGLSVSRISVNTNTSFGRITGESEFGLDNNYARSSMLVYTDTILVGDPNDIHGANVDAGDPDGGYHLITFWKNNMLWDFGNTWEMHPNTKLPILKDYPKVPEETQAPEMQYSFPLKDLDTISIYLNTRNGGNNAIKAVELPIEIDLGDMTQADSGWQELLTVIAEAGKYVNLDLSECDLFGTEPGIIFNPYADISTGKDKIIELTLPETASIIEAGSGENGAFQHFTALKSISGDNIGTIGSSAFKGCTTLEEVIFPSADMIGIYAFNLCTSLKEVIFGMAYDIGFSAFDECSALESVTLGWNIAPQLGTGIFARNSSQTITVKVPLGATTYTPYPGINIVSNPDITETWANGFRGGGWNVASSTFIDSSLINQNITLKIEGN